MRYNISFGKINNVDMEKVNKLIGEYNSDKGIGIHRIFDIGFDKLSEDIDDDKRSIIIEQYWDLVDGCFRNTQLIEEGWVTDARLNQNKGYGRRNFSKEFVDDLKKVKGGREFFRAIKDGYLDNGTHPEVEICLINTPSFIDSLNKLSTEVLENSDDLSIEQIDFIKWVYWWGTQILSKKGNRACIMFSKG